MGVPDSVQECIFVLYFARDCDCTSNLDFYGLSALIHHLNKQTKIIGGPRFYPRVYFWCLPLFCILHGIVTVSPTLTFMVCPPWFTILSTIFVVRFNKQINKKGSRILSKSVFLVLTFVLYNARDCDCISNLDFYGLPALIYKSGCTSLWLKITIVDVGRRIEVCQA